MREYGRYPEPPKFGRRNAVGEDTVAGRHEMGESRTTVGYILEMTKGLRGPTVDVN